MPRVRSLGSTIWTYAALACALSVPTLHPSAAVARPRKQAPPVPRTPSTPSSVEAPPNDTIPAEIHVPEVAPAPAEEAPSEEDPTEVRVSDSETEYIIDTSSSEALDADVQAAMEEERVDPAVLERRSRRFLGAGAPILAVGAAGLLGGALLGTFDEDADVGVEVWVPTMLVGAALVAIGIPLTARGVILKREAREGREAEAAQARVWAPSLSRTRDGTWTPGFAARF